MFASVNINILFFQTLEKIYCLENRDQVGMLGCDFSLYLFVLFYSTSCFIIVTEPANKLPDFFLLPVVKQLMIVVIFLLEVLLICAPIMAESHSLTVP